MRELAITARESGQRLDKYLKKYLREAPASFLYKMLRKKNITLNGRRAEGGEVICTGDLVRLYLSEETIRKFQTDPSPRPDISSTDTFGLSLLYEDEDILLLNKPAGLLTQPDRSGEPSAADLLPVLLKERGSLADKDLRAFRPAPLNRLDRNTSGILLAGKSMKGAQELSGLIRSESIVKEYLTVVAGEPPGDCIYRLWGRKDPSRNRMRVEASPFAGSLSMVTGIRFLAAGEECALLRVRLYTGRTHQIRATLAYLGSPVIGDRKYGRQEINERFRRRYGVRRQMLHAERITLPDGRAFVAEPPEDMRHLLKALDLQYLPPARSDS